MEELPAGYRIIEDNYRAKHNMSYRYSVEILVKGTWKPFVSHLGWGNTYLSENEAKAAIFEHYKATKRINDIKFAIIYSIPVLMCLGLFFI